MKQFPGVKQGKDYLFHAKKLLQSSQIEVSFPSEMATQTLGGHAFDVMYIEMSLTGMTVRQEYFATITKGYALSFITSFTTDEDKAELLNILKSISFE